MDNGKRLQFDVSELIEPIPFKAGSYEFTLPPDISLGDLTSIKREMDLIGKSATDETVDVAGAESRLWELFERLMAKADPSPPRPIREMFTIAAMVSILGFLLIEWGEAKNSITSLRSRTSTTGLSASQNSSEVSASTAAPSE